MQLMVTNKIQQIPVDDAHYHVVGLHSWDGVTTQPNLTLFWRSGIILDRVCNRKQNTNTFR